MSKQLTQAAKLLSDHGADMLDKLILDERKGIEDVLDWENVIVWENNWEEEATILFFEDGSKLRFSGGHADVE